MKLFKLYDYKKGSDQETAVLHSIQWSYLFNAIQWNIMPLENKGGTDNIG